MAGYSMTKDDLLTRLRRIEGQDGTRPDDGVEELVGAVDRLLRR